MAEFSPHSGAINQIRRLAELRAPAGPAGNPAANFACLCRPDVVGISPPTLASGFHAQGREDAKADHEETCPPEPRSSHHHCWRFDFSGLRSSGDLLLRL